jgi:hypothetical protein
MSVVPKKQPSRKHKYFYDLEVGKSKKITKYTRGMCQSLGSIVNFYNRKLYPKQFCQRNIDGFIHIFRDADKK